ncbi:hypothetical protein GUJ93_ZPchr0003g17017 [Zizania palustris]|uniref:Uncharacterized protein n=1 Tax=Zizania palustris TaxID=103762 RepID=A0A8J5SAT7_ZIZPA|nr:hypothetical protein GUJ93_ZPchr0003g17017 [Zizania palustris]
MAALSCRPGYVLPSHPLPACVVLAACLRAGAGDRLAAWLVRPQPHCCCGSVVPRCSVVVVACRTARPVRTTGRGPAVRAQPQRAPSRLSWPIIVYRIARCSCVPCAPAPPLVVFPPFFHPSPCPRLRGSDLSDSAHALCGACAQAAGLRSQ